MYAYIDLANIARTDSRIQSLSWMNCSSLFDGWLATGNTNHIVSVTYTSLKSNDNCSIPDRTNFNLRAHRTDVRLVAWNVPYQKLATIDEKGVIFVWIKNENRWSLELINDRGHAVIDMSWSYDGRMTAICYEDNFILVGSVTGQRYWSTILNLPQGKISAVTWTPDISHVIIGTTNGQLYVLDHHGNTQEILSITTEPIKHLMYSCRKFYPEAPDANATKFVNDDYILACTLENGRILLMNTYQDQIPIIIETNLQNIEIDWSYPDEILVVGGYRCINETLFENHICFYTKQGEFLDRVLIPQTTEPFSALCWTHGNEIVFVACATSVYTIWITHQSLPSLLSLCQMKIKENLLKNSREHLAQLSLPKNLQDNLLTYFRSIIKGFLPDSRGLRSFVCYPLKTSLRLQCTMKRLDDDKDKQTSSGPIYILYLEYLGGLIPLLTAKRVSKICPDFIIFDPQMQANEFEMKSSMNIKPLPRRKKFRSPKSRLNTFENLTNIQQINTNRSNLITQRHSIYVAPKEINNEHEQLTQEDSLLMNKNQLYHQRSRKRTTTKENNHRLCTVGANIWGTRFKFYSHSNNLPEVLGSVTYKTSLLHLQPRQMTVTLANNYPIHRQQAVIHPSTIVQNSSINRSRSSSPTTSVSNLIRPLSPPCIQVKEPLCRSSSTNHLHNNLSSPSILHTNNSNIPETCFEPETYRHLSTLNSNQQKNLSRSDPTLNQTRRTILINHQTLQTDDAREENDEIESLNSDEEIIENQQPLIPIESRKNLSPRHRLLLCTSRARDSVSVTDSERVDDQESSFYIMQNRPPVWNEQSQVYQLDFGGRVTLESAKNFQIEFNGKQVIQFGRIENNCYTLDFEWPFSPLQAFAVALANITQRLK